MFTKHLIRENLISVKIGNEGTPGDIFSGDLHMCEAHSLHLHDVFSKAHDELLLALNSFN